MTSPGRSVSGNRTSAESTFFMRRAKYNCSLSGSGSPASTSVGVFKFCAENSGERCTYCSGFSVANGERIEDVVNVKGQRGRADFDVKKRLVFNGVWEVPNHFQSRVLNQILGHWHLRQRDYTLGLPR
jgi:hypothetical protein